MTLHKLSERTYLTLDGKPTTNELEANTLLGNAGDEIPGDQAVELGLVDHVTETTGHTLEERTFLTADGTVTTDETEGNSLLGNAGDEIPMEQATELGLVNADEAATEPSKDDVMAEYARHLRKMKADEVRSLATAQSLSTEGNADAVRGRLMEAFSAAYDAEHADGGQSSDDGDPDVDDSGAQ